MTTFYEALQYVKAQRAAGEIKDFWSFNDHGWRMIHARSNDGGDYVAFDEREASGWGDID